MKRLGGGILLAAIALTTVPVTTAGERLEAIFFPERHPTLQGDWARPRFSGDPEANSRVHARSAGELELQLLIPERFRQPPQPVRIFLIVPAQPPGLRGPGGFEVSWTTRGRFLAGTARPGNRVLLFQGIADAPVLRDFVTFSFTLDARDLLGPLRFEPEYEIERG